MIFHTKIVCIALTGGIAGLLMLALFDKNSTSFPPDVSLVYQEKFVEKSFYQANRAYGIDWEYESFSQVLAPLSHDKKGLQLQFKLNGLMNITVLLKGGNRYLYLQMENFGRRIQWLGDDASVVEKNIRTLLGNGFFVVVSSQGVFTNYIFSKPSLKLEINILKQMIGQTQVVWQKEERQSWVAKEVDETGNIQAFYTIFPGESIILEKKIEPISQSNGVGKWEFAGNSEWQLDAERGLWSHFYAIQEKIFYIQGEMQGENLQHLQAETIEYSQISSTQKKILFNRLLTMKNLAKKVLAQNQQNQFSEERSLESFQHLVTDLTKWSKKSSEERKKNRIKYFLEIQDQIANTSLSTDELVEILQEVDPKNPEFFLWVAGLSSLGDDKAQKILKLLVIHHQGLPKVVNPLLVAMARAKSPSQESEDFLQQVATDYGSGPTYTTAILALGILASQLKNKQDSPVIKARYEQLLTEGQSRLNIADSPKELQLALGFLGNIGEPRSHNAINNFLTYPHRGVRLAAGRALRRDQSSQATKMLHRAILQEENSEVRIGLIEVASRKKVSQAENQFLFQAFQQETHIGIQKKLVTQLWKNVDKYPKNRQRLLQLSHGTSQVIRDFIIQLLAET